MADVVATYTGLATQEGAVPNKADKEDKNYQSASASETESTDDTTSCDDLVTRRDETIPKRIYERVSSGQSFNRISQAPPRYEDVVPRRNRISFSFVVLLGSIIAIGIAWTVINVPLSQCPSLDPPLNGHIVCAEQTKSIMQCNFSCLIGYNLVGHEEIFCLGDKWNYPAPMCKKSCSPLPKIDHGQITCSDGFNVNSTCNVNCIDNREIKDQEELTCLESGLWSHPEPSCICPNCRVGDMCQNSIKWKSIDDELDSITFFANKKVVYYAEHAIICRAEKYVDKWKLKFHGKCKDKSSDKQYDCEGYDSSSGSVKHAAAELIRELVNTGEYPAPCDPESMPPRC